MFDYVCRERGLRFLMYIFFSRYDKRHFAPHRIVYLSGLVYGFYMYISLRNRKLIFHQSRSDKHDERIS